MLIKLINRQKMEYTVKVFIKLFSGILRLFGGHLATEVSVKVVFSQQLASHLLQKR